MKPPIIEHFVTPNFNDLSYTFGFVSELISMFSFMIALGFTFYLYRKNVLFRYGGRSILLAFLLFFLESLMNFIDGNLIWFNETTPIILNFPPYQIWRIIRFLLIILAYYFLAKGFGVILNKARIVYGIEETV